MPWMRWRVVCALREVMATCAPTMRLSSVDLPTLGRPTIAAVPVRYGPWAELFGGPRPERVERVTAATARAARWRRPARPLAGSLPCLAPRFRDRLRDTRR